MKPGQRTLRGSDREYALILAVAVVASGLALAVALRPAGRRASSRPLATNTIPTPGPVIGRTPIPAAARPPALTAADLAAATTVARRFLTSYLPVLYGRRPVTTLVDADAHVRAELTAAGRAPPAPRNRRPRVAQLTARVQAGAEVVAIAVIADDVQPPYEIVCQLSDTGGGWQVSQLANY